MITGHGRTGRQHLLREARRGSVIWRCSGWASEPVLGDEPPTCRPCQFIARAEATGLVDPDSTAWFVYYASRDGLIKIGSSGAVANRMGTLRAELLAVERVGARRVHGPEYARHRQFAELRSHGEWFLPGEPLLAHIAGLRQLEKASA